MKAVVFHGMGDIRLENAPEPHIDEQTDAIVRLTASAICGTDLHMVRGTRARVSRCIKTRFYRRLLTQDTQLAATEASIG